ncbi:MAG: hypothetical protein N4A35_06545 [Flavobacteriales bacterium]|jgi:hypothetical protein|nr:hypothetical protein [Flavobacteriales bacterium]
MGRRKKKRPPKAQEEPVEVSYLPLKVLCFMSLAGFIISMVADTGNYISFGSFDEMKSAPDQTQFEILETQLEQWKEIGLDVSKRGVEKISVMYAVRTFIDIFAMVGVVFMYFRLKIGYIIYTIFQFTYIAVPYFFFGGLATFVVPFSSIAITLIYVALFTAQRKHLIR